MAKFDEERTMQKLKAAILVSFIFLIIGMTLQLTAFHQEFTEFAPMLDQIAGLPKAQLDTAPVGSEISNLKIEVAKFPPKLMTFKLVGMGNILTGIFILLFVIIQALKMMPIRLAGVIQKKRR